MKKIVCTVAAANRAKRLYASREALAFYDLALRAMERSERDDEQRVQPE